MKKYLPYIAAVLVVTAISCKKQDEEKPKVIYDATAKTKQAVPEDTTQTEIADLPIHMDGTNYLIHPIGSVSGDKKGSKSYESGSGFTVSNYGEFQITGYLQNLKFQEVGKDTIYALTDKPVLIETATYLKTFADKSKKQLMVYSVADMDTNKDNKLDSNDIKSIYMSDISGKDFAKISADFHELIDWKVLESRNLLYFRTIEDTNKDGEFDKTDAIHYYYLNLLDKDRKVQEYKPV